MCVLPRMKEINVPLPNCILIICLEDFVISPREFILHVCVCVFSFYINHLLFIECLYIYLQQSFSQLHFLLRFYFYRVSSDAPKTNLVRPPHERIPIFISIDETISFTVGLYIHFTRFSRVDWSSITKSISRWAPFSPFSAFRDYRDGINDYAWSLRSCHR